MLEIAVQVGELPSDGVVGSEQLTVDNDLAVRVQHPAQEVRAGSCFAEEARGTGPFHMTPPSVEKYARTLSETPFHVVAMT